MSTPKFNTECTKLESGDVSRTSKQVELVATREFVKLLLPEKYERHRGLANKSWFGDEEKTTVDPSWEPPNRGPLSARFNVMPSSCKTKLGAWLAEHVHTTRFDDDLSIVTLKFATTYEENETNTMLAQLAGHHIRDSDGFERFQNELLAWAKERAEVVRAFGISPFRNVSIVFQWPVFGAAGVKDADTTEAYFDLCARQIYGLNAVSATV